MTTADQTRILDAVLDTWERNHTALLNLLGVIPDGGLDARAMPGSPTIGQLCAHMHHERMISVFENAPECAGVVPAQEWEAEQDVQRITLQLTDSYARVRDAVRRRVEAEQALDRDFAHPIQLVLFLIFHEGYHHGQIKLALKAAGTPIADDVIGPAVWDVWRAR